MFNTLKKLLKWTLYLLGVFTLIVAVLNTDISKHNVLKSEQKVATKLVNQIALSIEGEIHNLTSNLENYGEYVAKLNQNSNLKSITSSFLMGVISLKPYKKSCENYYNPVTQKLVIQTPFKFKRKRVCLQNEISLAQLNRFFIGLENLLGEAYFSLFYNEVCWVHPNPSFIGIKKSDLSQNETITSGKYTEFSEHLNASVSRSSKSFEIPNLKGKFRVLVSIPNKNPELFELSKYNLIVISILLILAIVLGMGLMIYQKRETKTIELALKKPKLTDLTSFLNPMFPLHMLAYLDKLDSSFSRKVGDYIAISGKFEKSIYEEKSPQNQSLKQQIKLVKLFIQVQQMQFNNLELKVSVPYEIMSKKLPTNLLLVLIDKTLSYNEVGQTDTFDIEIGWKDGFGFISSSVFSEKNKFVSIVDSSVEANELLKEVNYQLSVKENRLFIEIPMN